jgi:hypothetical protein
MRSTASNIAIALVFTACHFAKAAKNPDSDESESSSESSESAKSGGAEKSEKSDESSKASDTDQPTTPASALGTSGIGRTTARAEKATIKDDTEKKDEPCTGAVIGDLLASLSQASCELPANAPSPTQQTTKDVLEVKATADSPKVAPGSTAKITVVFKNKGKTKLPLDFTVDPDPRITFELHTPKGARVDKPAGNEPSLPSEASSNDAPEPHTARVTLFPNGTATLSLPWQAVKYKWASKERAKGAIPGRGYPRDPAGPLPRGKYVLRVVMPMSNIDEGVEHEITQPRVNIEIAGTAAPPTPVAAAPVPAKKETASPANSATSDEAIEAKFLKATASPAPSTPKKH